jgi:hypothetical protein
MIKLKKPSIDGFFNFSQMAFHEGFEPPTDSLEGFLIIFIF